LKQGLTLVVYDCYRPQRATNAFVKWANDDAADQTAKDRFFQELKSTRSFPRATSAGDPRTQPGSLSISHLTGFFLNLCCNRKLGDKISH
jgi:D-alanyl-D-alanine dipeptidase